MSYSGLFLKPRLLMLLLILAVGIAYSNSFFGPFIYDDLESILHNQSLRSLPQAIAQIDYGSETVTGRPILNFSFALNHFVGGLNPFGFHVTNFLIHGLNMLLFLQIFRRALCSSYFSEAIRKDSLWIAAAIAGLWGLHPLQTGAVTYIVQRAESLMTLFYLLTLYCFLGSQQSARPRAWLFFSCFFCYLGMATKEVMVSAPVLVLLFDFIFIERKWRRLWSARRFYYYGLISSWGMVAFLNHATKTRSGAYGFTGSITLGEHLQTQAWALIHYLRLIIWPDPLVLDYGIVRIGESGVYWTCGLLILIIVLGIGWLFWRNPGWGFWGVWAIFLLAPTSSIIPMQSEPLAEHRVYLALASVLFYGIVGAYHLWGGRIFPFVLLISFAFGIRTYLRNSDYQSMESIWRATVLAAPLNPRAHNNYAGALFRERKWEEAEFHLKETIRLEPRHLNVYLNYGRLHQAREEWTEAETKYRRAIELYPHFSEAKRSLGELLLRQGRIQEAEKIYREVIREEPKDPLAYLNLGGIYESHSEWGEAEKIYLQAFENEVNEPLITERLGKIQEKLMQ